MPGTTNRKGDDTAERPWRRCKLLAKGSDAVVPIALLEQLAATAPAATTTAATTAAKDERQAAAKKARAAWEGRDRGSVVRRAAAYAAKLPPAIEGENGSAACFRVACVLVCGFGLSAEEAMPLLLEYNQRCQPPWSEGELQHKLDGAAKQAAENPDEVGHLLGNKPAKADGEKGKASKEDEKAGKRSALLDLAEARAELFHTRTGVPYARVQVPDRELLLGEEGEQCWHRETIAVESDAFKHWLGAAYMGLYGEAVSRHTLDEACWQVASLARYRGKQQEIFVRVAAEGEKVVYLDLGDPEWRAVRITANGWQVVADCPVAFRRPQGLLPLPTPEKGGSIDELRPFCNTASQEDFVLLVSWLVACFSPRGPFPVLGLLGEQGMAKTTTARVLRSLCDPNECDTGGMPKSEDDLCCAANGSRVLVLDNLSHIPQWLSDALCRLATGTGWRKRQLYTDTNEVLVRACLPCSFTSVVDVAMKPDLLERSIVVHLPLLADEQRRDEEAFWQAFEQAKPRLLGVVLDAVAAALRNKAGVCIDKLPRMADFARWATAAESAFGWEAGTVLAAYRANAETANRLALEQSPLVSFLRAIILARAGQKWIGTMSDLLVALQNETAGKLRTDRVQGWPSSPSALGHALQRLAPALRKIGWVVEQPAGGRRGRYWRLAIPAEQADGQATWEDEPVGPTGQ